MRFRRRNNPKIKHDSPNVKPLPFKSLPTNGQGIGMQFSNYVRKPFTVEAVEVTADNIAEVAKYVGDLREEDDGTKYILVDRRLVPNIARVYTGFFMTKMGKNVRCYSRKIFRDQFTEEDEHTQEWVEYMNKDREESAS